MTFFSTYFAVLYADVRDRVLCKAGVVHDAGKAALVDHLDLVVDLLLHVFSTATS